MPQSRDFNTMQEEALRRMREMQKRSKTSVNPGAEHVRGEDHEKNEQKTNPKPAERQQTSFLSDLKIDPEKAMLLLMLMILYKNKADMKLILALCYLLM